MRRTHNVSSIASLKCPINRPSGIIRIFLSVGEMVHSQQTSYLPHLKLTYLKALPTDFPKELFVCWSHTYFLSEGHKRACI